MVSRLVYIGGGVVGFLMTLATIPPEEATSNVAKWAHYLGVDQVPALLSDPSVDKWVGMSGAALLAVSVTVLVIRQWPSIFARPIVADANHPPLPQGSVARRLTHAQKVAIARSISDGARSKKIAIVRDGRDECIDFAHDLASALRLSGVSVLVDEPFFASDDRDHGVKIYHYPGKLADDAANVCEMLHSFGIECNLVQSDHRVGEKDSIFDIVIHRA